MNTKLNFNDYMIFEKNPNIHEIKTEEGVIILKSNLKDDYIYYLDNAISIKIWDLINGKNSLKKIIQELLLEYEETEELIKRDLNDFISELFFKKLITKC